MTQGIRLSAKKPLKILYPVLILSFIFLPTLSAYALDVPKLQGYVNDYADMISPSAEDRIEDMLKSFEQTDSTQIVILTVPSLEGEALEDFSIKVAESWKIGVKGKGNGVILLVSKEDRKIRIEIGRGLEGNLTDLMSGRIIDQVMKPRFKSGDFDGGFINGVNSLIDAARGEFKAEDNQMRRKRKSPPPFFTLLIFGLGILIVLGSQSRILGGIGGAAGLPLLVHFSLLPLGIIGSILLAAAGLGVGLLLPSIFSISRHHGRGIWPGGGYYGGGSGFGGGGFSSGGSDFGGGGGFSGGGGDFGGGGASGDW